MDGDTRTDGLSEGPGANGFDLQRAEVLVDQMGQRVGGLLSSLGIRVLRRAALAREEAEDIWAEAQSKARGHDQF